MNAKKTYEEAENIKLYIQHTFGSPPLTTIQKTHLKEKFSDFHSRNPRIYHEIVSGELDWERFKKLAEMAYCLHLQMHTNTDLETAKNVQF